MTNPFGPFTVPRSPFTLRTMPRAILFDFNGVIVDDEPQHCQALIATLADYGFVLDPEGYYREYLGFDDGACFRYALGQMGPVDQARVEEATRAKAVRYERAIRESLRLVPGAAEFIKDARREGRWAGR
jgi:beta-phosphoglucomutase-like phosphatase (HAD superfamily)